MDDYELQKDILIKPNATLRDVVELCMNGDISYADAREWCMENDISLGQFDRWLYGALRKSDNPARMEPKEPWPYRVVAGIRVSWSRQKISRRPLRKACHLRRSMLRVISARGSASCVGRQCYKGENIMTFEELKKELPTIKQKIEQVRKK